MSVKMRSKYSGSCKVCSGFVNVGDMVIWTPGQKGVSHTKCPELSVDTDKIVVESLVNIAGPGEHPDFPGQFKHQQEVLNTVIETPDARLYLAFDPGLGKTKSSLDAALATDNFPLVIVCPSVVKINWQRETERWTGKEAQILSGRKPKEIESDVVIINYDILEAWADHLIDMEPQAIVFDEIHYIKNVEAKRTKAALRVASEVPGMRLGLSGTPTPNSVYDLLGPLEALGLIDAFGGRKKYINRYCPPVRTQWGVSYKASRNREELRQNLLNAGFMRRKREDCLDLPEKVITEIPIRIKDIANLEFYEPLAAKMASATMSEAERVLEEEDQDRVYAQFLQEREDTGMAKVDDIVGMAKDITEPLVIMVHHKKVVNELMDRLKKQKPVKLVGGMTEKARQKSIDNFQNGVTDVIICSISAAGIGINLQRGRAMIFGELPYTYAEVEQAESRCHRSGAKFDLSVYRMVALDTTDEMLMGIINKKESVSAEVEDGELIDPKTYGNVLARKLLKVRRRLDLKQTAR